MGNLRLVNTGSGPSTGDGDQLRIAFTKINNNFQDLVSGNIELTTTAGGVANSTLIFGGDSISSIGDITLTTDQASNSVATWIFKASGALSFPDNTQQATAFISGDY